MFRKINEKITYYEKKLSLKNKYPDYFSRQWIFHIAFILIIMLVGIDYSLNDNSFYSFSMSCHSSKGEGCINPLYDCSKYSLIDSLVKPCTNYQDDKVKERICSTGVCDKTYLEEGESFGRQDFLYKYNPFILFGILALAFGLNHYLYSRNKRNESLS